MAEAPSETLAEEGSANNDNLWVGYTMRKCGFSVRDDGGENGWARLRDLKPDLVCFFITNTTGNIPWWCSSLQDRLITIDSLPWNGTCSCRQTAIPNSWSSGQSNKFYLSHQRSALRAIQFVRFFFFQFVVKREYRRTFSNISSLSISSTSSGSKLFFS